MREQPRRPREKKPKRTDTRAPKRDYRTWRDKSEVDIIATEITIQYLVKANKSNRNWYEMPQ